MRIKSAGCAKSYRKLNTRPRRSRLSGHRSTTGEHGVGAWSPAFRLLNSSSLKAGLHALFPQEKEENFVQQSSYAEGCRVVFHRRGAFARIHSGGPATGLTREVSGFLLRAGQ